MVTDHPTRRVGSAPPSVKALTFDVFGSVVDTRGSLIEELTAYGDSKHMDKDWGAFADGWVSGYALEVSRILQGAPWISVDEINRRNLEKLLVKHNIQGLTEVDKVHLNEAWYRLKPWPDAVAGLHMLRKGGLRVATLANGNVRLLTDLSANAGLPWDYLLSAEAVQSYKPDPAVYQMAAEKLSLRPGEIMMVAAHAYDLQEGAKPVGFQTAFVSRPDEFGPGSPPQRPADTSGIDLFINSFTELAGRLGAPA
jgi:2-haloacid dehalogenase